jgi:N-acetylglucosamine malate deacetylase 1
MTVLYVLAHFDDESAALPLIRRDQVAGADQRFLYVMDYRTRALAETRHAETRRFLQRFGLDPASAVHAGRDTGVLDGSAHLNPRAAYDALKDATAGVGKVERIVALAWEGGHPDHDTCCALAVRLAADLGHPPLEQISLYNGPGLPGILYRAARPLPQNGPTKGLKLSAGEWASWGLAVTEFPSQAKTWLGLWPAMALTFLRQGEFRWQDLDPQRIQERPHEGPLLYERMFKTPYEAVRAGVDSLFA